MKNTGFTPPMPQSPNVLAPFKNGVQTFKEMTNFYSNNFSRISPVNNPPIFGAALWYDFSDNSTITSVGGAISAVADKSGNGYNLSQGVGINQLTVAAAGTNGLLKQSARAVGTQFMNLASSFNFPNNCTWLFAKSENAPGLANYTGFIFTDGPTNNIAGVYGTLASPYFNMYVAGGVGPTSTGFTSPQWAGKHQYDSSHVNTGALYTSWSANVDTAVIALDGGSNLAVATPVITQLNNQGTVSLVTSDLQYGEIIVYPRVLSGDELTYMRSYLKTKWGTP
jgi:hypothetical protein